MIRRLSIRNFVLVRELEIEFGPGLQVMTGETGVGKSVIAGALALTLGDPPRGSVLHHPEQTAFLEVVFDRPDTPAWAAIAEEYGIEATDDEVFIAREIHPSNTSRFFLNGRRTTVAVVREIRRFLLEFQSQRDQILLFERDVQLDFLDRFGGHSPALEEYRMAFAEFGETDRALKRAESLHRTEQEKRALYEYQVDELERASLREQEDDILETELNLLQHAEDIRLRTNEFEGEAYDAENSLLDRIRFHLHQLSPYSGDSTHLREACTALENVCDNLESAVIEVRRMIDQLSVDDDRLHTVESRLDEINRLKYKYKKNLPDLIVYYEEIAGELKAMGSREEEIEALTRQKEAVGKRVLETATVLSDLRKATAVRMASVIEADLRQLAIASARFVIDVNPAQSGSLIGDVAMGPDGGDDVIFRFSANPEKAPDILSQCASGGELSRILLTLKKALAERDRGRCIVFDEVDTGIGGKTADILGEFISEISDFHQVLCITHLPQVAVYAENHYAIEKKIDANETIIDFHKLNSDERRWEIARMLSGTQTEAALAHADEMLGNITRKGKSYV